MPAQLTPGQCIPPCRFLPQRLLVHQPRRKAGGREGGREAAAPGASRSLAVPRDAPAAAGTEGPGSGAAAGRCWQGNAMVTRRRDAEHRASSPRWGSGKKKGTMEAELPPQAVLLCCSAPSVSCQALAWLRPPAALPAGLETPTPPSAGSVSQGGAALGEPHAVKGSRCAGMRRESVSEKRGWPFGRRKGVQTACNEPRRLLGTDASLFFSF